MDSRPEGRCREPRQRPKLGIHGERREPAPSPALPVGLRSGPEAAPRGAWRGFPAPGATGGAGQGGRGPASQQTRGIRQESLRGRALATCSASRQVCGAVSAWCRRALRAPSPGPSSCQPHPGLQVGGAGGPIGRWPGASHLLISGDKAPALAQLVFGEEGGDQRSPQDPPWGGRRFWDAEAPAAPGPGPAGCPVLWAALLQRKATGQALPPHLTRKQEEKI